MSARRNKGHRAKFIKYVKEIERGGNHQSYVVDDEYALGDETFEKNYKFTILEYCSPRNLYVKEHLWVQKLRSLNRLRLFGLPLLD